MMRLRILPFVYKIDQDHSCSIIIEGTGEGARSKAAMKSSRRAIIFRIIMFYFIISVVWITTSDSILFALVRDADLARQISIYKGWAFVVVTAALLAGLLRRELKLLEAAHGRIEESEQRFRLLYEDAPISFQTLDVEGRILIVNRQWSQDFGFEPAQVVGRPFADLVAHLD